MKAVVLVTGVTGFIGGRLVPSLKERGYEVRGTGRRPLTSFSGGTYDPADLTDEKDCLRITRGVTHIIHTAGKAGTWGPFSEFANANVLATRRLLEAAKRNGVRRFVNLSSPSVYFDFQDRLGIPESFLPRHFSNAYAETKWQAEQLVQAAHEPGFGTLSLRPRGVIGAGDTNWLTRIIALRQADQLIQPGPGNATVDFTSVSNLVDVIGDCLELDPAHLGQAYNITNGAPVKLWSFIEDALTAVGLDGQRKKVPLPVAMGLARVNAKFHQWRGTKKEPAVLPIKVGVAAYSMTLDIEKARNALNYHPRVTTEEALGEFTEWWNKRVS